MSALRIAWKTLAVATVAVLTACAGSRSVPPTAGNDDPSQNLARRASASGPDGSSSATTSPTPAPFNDYVTFGYDNRRNSFNPNSTAFQPAALSALHLGWQTAIGGGDYNAQSQPVLATEISGHAGVLFTGGGSGNVYAYDARSGSELWHISTGQATYACENGQTIYFGVGGTAAYDPGSASLYIVGNRNATTNTPLTSTLYHLSGATGAVLGSVAIAAPSASWPSLDFAHTSVTLGTNGLAYVGTGATCDISTWRGRIVATSVPSMSIAKTFYTTWEGSDQPWGGGGVWGWGGVSLDASGNVYAGVGNADDGKSEHGTIKAPFRAAPAETSAYGDGFVRLTDTLSSVIASDHPIPPGVLGSNGDSIDLDVTGSPVIFRPSGAGCPLLAAMQGKAGSLYIFDAESIGNGPIATYQLSPSTYADGFLGNPAYSPVTNLLYVDVPSSDESLYPPGMIAINPGCGSPSVQWTTAFGPDSYGSGSNTSPGLPRSVPAVSAGGIIFVGTICTVSGDGCAATTAGDARRVRHSARPLICCAPPGTSGGALWAIDANTGTVLNGGNPLLFTNAPLRVPPTIDGDWVFVLDNGGDLYGLTLDPSVPAIQTHYRAPDPRQIQSLDIRHPG